jgi:hypothetical protein
VPSLWTYAEEQVLIKNVLFAVLQFILLLLIFLVGSLFPPFHLEHVLGVTPEGTRIFIWDGALLMTAVFAIILAIEAVRKRIGTAGLWTTLAFALAAAAGFAAKFGFLTRPLG